MTTRLEIKNIRRQLRQNQTKAETILWLKLKNRQLDNKKFQRQYSIILNVSDKIYFYIADFYCHEFKLIIEVDGGIHLKPKQKEHDQFRTDRLNELGIKIIRFTNEEVINNIEKVLSEIKKHFK
ncbi:MAG: endonuclease domain-containing protein [Candidatus Magasanikiibacteriota bacterium]